MAMTKERKEELMQRYQRAGHAVQSGVAMWHHYEPGEQSPKHLRTGVNMAMVDNAALTGLLIKKGIITDEEHLEALCEAAEREVADYESRLTEKLGKAVKLA